MTGEVIDARLFFGLRGMRKSRPAEHPYVYSAVYLRSDVSVGELLQLLARSDLAATTEHGATVIHRKPTPDGAA